jgi:glycosyltransferase involved in cell wall biosynthesis
VRDGEDVVAVVIPAYNAEATIGETLISVRNQSHSALDIIVVDDGSSDATREIASYHAELDRRVRVITQVNSGVAAARNRGIEETRAVFVAPLDADDLWRPRKIERQLRAIRAAGPETGLVYCWSLIIDGDGQITSRGDRPRISGDVLPELFYGNFVGNGSTALMRRKQVIDVGGFDPSLRARNAQGCEDWKLYLEIAERSHFTVIPDYLTGYRYTREAMSGDVSRMLRSDAFVRAEMLERYPENQSELKWGRRYYIQWLLNREVENGNWQNCLTLLREPAQSNESMLRTAFRCMKIAAKLGRQCLYGRPTKKETGGRFLQNRI